MARIWRGCGCGVGQWLQLQFSPYLGISMCRRCGPKRKKKSNYRGIFNVILHPGRTFELGSKILLKGDLGRIG